MKNIFGKIFSSKFLSTKFLTKLDKKHFIIIASIFVAIIILILFISMLFWMGSKNKKNNCNISKSIIQLSDIWTCTWNFISYSDSYKASQSWVFTFTWSKWVNWDKIQNLVWQTQISSTFFYYKFFDKVWFDGNTFLYDEFNGLKAWILVFVMRSFGHKNIYLLEWKSIKSLLSQNKSIIDDDLKNLFSGDNEKIYDKWYIDNGKYKVVFDTTWINLWGKDLFLYISDKSMMESDTFYSTNKDKYKDNFKNIYISYFISIEWDSIKTKDEISSLLFNEWIDLKNYDNIYIYYPIEWWKAGLIWLIFMDYFG